MLWVRGLSTVAVLLVTLARGEDSCPAGAAGARCKAAASTAGTPSREKRSLNTNAQPRADLITQEVDELTAMRQLSLDRIELLEEMRGVLNSGVNVSLPEKYVRVLNQPMPAMSDIVSRQGKATASSADDFLHSKTVIPQQEPVSFVKFLALRSRVSGPTSLLVAVQADSSAKLFTPTGELVLAFSLGHDQPVTHLLANAGGGAQSAAEDTFITTADAGGNIRVHKVDVRSARRIAPKEEKSKRSAADPKVEKVSQYLSSQLNVTAKLTVQMQVPPDSNGEPPVVTALAVVSQQGVRYFVAGDAEGKVSVFGRNGTFSAKIDAASTPGAKVLALNPQGNVLFFHSGDEWGFLHLDKLQVQHMTCPQFEGHLVTGAVIDSQKASRVLIADEEGEIWVFNVKEKKNCKVEHRFPKGTTLPSVKLASSGQGFVLALERPVQGSGAAFISAINMGHLGKRKTDTDASVVMWRRARPAVRDWAVHRRSQQGELLAFLSEDGREIEVMEILNMQVREPPAKDSFGDFQTPVMIVAVVLVLGYQYVKNKGRFSGGGGGGSKKEGKIDWDSAEMAKMRENIKAKKAEKAKAAGKADS